jgi:8-oxo-dGTP pyrophosphatase MutT (NUDIX family)
MSSLSPHVTVASVVKRENKYLMVEERDKTSGEMVFNQPAGHLEANESLVEAALREAYEETGWRINLTGVLGMSLYLAPTNGKTYYRTTFLADPDEFDESAIIDPDIHAVHWMDFQEIQRNSARMRSPLVLASIERQRSGICFPLDILYGS